jgi:hypothetical protein
MSPSADHNVWLGYPELLPGAKSEEACVVDWDVGLTRFDGHVG